MMQILEKRFEDWICENLHDVVHRDARLIGRQITLPSGGILDVLAVHEECGPGGGDEFQTVFTIIEVKREEIDDDAVLQVLRYMGAFKLALRESARLALDPEVRREDSWRQHPTVRGVLAAPSISNSAGMAIVGTSHLCYANLAINIQARRWERMLPGGINEDRVGTLAASMREYVLDSIDRWVEYENQLMGKESVDEVARVGDKEEVDAD